jgi:serine/threonine-protein kinase
VHAILGAEAEAARSFRPPPPELAEDDLRLFDVESESTVSRDGLSLRELGGAEPSAAPRHQAPLPPIQAVVRHRESQETSLPPGRHTGEGDSRWLIHFAIVAAAAGLVAIVFIAIFFRS